MDPSQGHDCAADVTIGADGRIEAVSALPGVRKGPALSAGRCIRADGLWVLPGLVDLHVHLRQPGMTRAECVASGTAAAAAGGFRRIVCMPNTRPVLDDPGVLRSLVRRIRDEAVVDVHPAAALSVDLAGRELSPLAALREAGAEALSDDGMGTGRSEVLAEALRFGARHGLVVMVHAEDRRLSGCGVMNAGPVARRLALPGIPAAAERVRVERDLRVLARAGGRLHFQHLSTLGALNAVRRAKAAGLGVTCELTPHHLTLSDRDLERSADRRAEPDPDFKMNPPLRGPGVCDALRAALADGTADALATDHAPHLPGAKRLGFARAPFGVIGLETALALTIEMIHQGLVDRMRAVALWTSGPARILGREASLAPGGPADLILVDPEASWIVEPGKLRSRSANTPFKGRALRGKVLWNLIAGREVFRAEGFEPEGMEIRPRKG
ncbi:MAG: dihydroorotase [Deltaproteobacteria bacterium]|nr:dihydroorotase [Deltaproteobacteria bacterium]